MPHITANPTNRPSKELPTFLKVSTCPTKAHTDTLEHRILKICTLLPIYSLLSFISIAEPDAYVYLEPWCHYFEAIALGSFFLLLCEFVSPSSDFRDVFFAALETKASRKARERGKPAVDGLEWYRVSDLAWTSRRPTPQRLTILHRNDSCAYFNTYRCPLVLLSRQQSPRPPANTVLTAAIFTLLISG
jgi:hypothetical protein